MESIEELRERAIDIVDEHLKDFKVVVTYKNNILKHYVDLCGQREHYLVHYDYRASKDKERGHECWNGLYLIIRKLSFTNEEDEGKEGALLGSIDLKNAEDISIVKTIKKISITADYLTIHITKD